MLNYLIFYAVFKTNISLKCVYKLIILLKTHPYFGLLAVKLKQKASWHSKHDSSATLGWCVGVFN